MEFGKRVMIPVSKPPAGIVILLSEEHGDSHPGCPDDVPSSKVESSPNCIRAELYGLSLNKLHHDQGQRNHHH